MEPHHRTGNKSQAQPLEIGGIDILKIVGALQKGLSFIYLEPKWPLFWLKRALFWRVDLQK